MHWLRRLEDWCEFRDYDPSNVIIWSKAVHSFKHVWQNHSMANWSLAESDAKSWEHRQVKGQGGKRGKSEPKCELGIMCTLESVNSVMDSCLWSVNWAPNLWHETCWDQHYLPWQLDHERVFQSWWWSISMFAFAPVGWWSSLHILWLPTRFVVPTMDFELWRG